MERAMKVQHMITKIMILSVVFLNIFLSRLRFIPRPAGEPACFPITFLSLLFLIFLSMDRIKSRSFPRSCAVRCAEPADDRLHDAVYHRLSVKGSAFCSGAEEVFPVSVSSLGGQAETPRRLRPGYGSACTGPYCFPSPLSMAHSSARCLKVVRDMPSSLPA